MKNPNILFRASADEFYVSIMGEIGWDVSAKDIISVLEWAGDAAITMSINSPGGAALEALAVYDYIRDKGSKVTARIYGICGSAATVIACAAKEVYIGENSFYFVHRAYVQGGAQNEGTTYTLEQLNKRLEDIYTSRTKLGKRKVRELMDKGDEGYFLTAGEAIDHGFVDGLLAEAKIAAMIETMRPTGAQPELMNKEEIKQGVEAPEVVPEQPVEAVPEATEDTVEVDVPVNFIDAFKGHVRVKVAAEYKAQLDTAIAERQEAETKLAEAVAEVETLQAKVEQASDAVAEVETLKAKVAELEAKVKQPLASATEQEAPAEVQEPGEVIAPKEVRTGAVASDAMQNINQKLAQKRQAKTKN